MKRRISCSYLFWALLLSNFGACVPSDEYDIPEPAIPEDAFLETNTSLDAVAGAYYQSSEEVDVVTFKEELVLEAYVVSSDEAGNFYKELILQDSSENPTAGVAVQLNQASYFETFDFGRKVYVKLKGLSLGELNGVLALGMANGKVIEQIPLSRIQEFIIRTPEVAEITPLTVRAIEFNDRMENLFVQLENYQFSSFYVNEENPFSFGSEDNDEFDGERKVESCNGDFPFIVSTSTFANFKYFDLPRGSGNLRGVLTRDFYDEFFTVYLNSPSDLQFDNPGRCDLLSFDCGLSSNTGSRILFMEDFEDQSNNSPISGNGWTNFVQEGSEAWEAYTATGVNASLGRSARVQTSGSGDYKTISWLISPPINFDAQGGEVLQFASSTSFGDNSMLELFYSNDWNGTVEDFSDATWKVVSSAYVATNSDYFGDWIPSGRVSLACAEGVGYIAFRYTGSDLTHYDGVFELDNVIISSN